MPRVVDAYRLLADPLLVVIAADRADERPSPFGNWPPTASPCRRRRRTAGGPPCPAGLPRGRIHPFNAVRHHRHRAPTPPRPGRPRHCAHPPDGHRPGHTRYPHGAQRGPPDPPPAVRGDASRRHCEPHGHRRHRRAAHSCSSRSHHTPHVGLGAPSSGRRKRRSYRLMQRVRRASSNASWQSGSDLLSVRYCSYAARLGKEKRA